jgi:hypothetical protein
MPFSRSRSFYPKRLTVMCAYILRMGGPGDRTHYPGVTRRYEQVNSLATLGITVLHNDPYASTEIKQILLLF